MIFLIKKYRLKKKFTLKSLAAIADCSYSYLSELENNTKNNPGTELIERIGHALHVCPILLMGGCLSHFCTPNCYYYKNKYDKLPPEGKKKVKKVMEMLRNIEEEYKDYLN